MFWTQNKLLRCKLPVHKAKINPVKISIHSANIIRVNVHKFHIERTSHFISCIDGMSLYVWWISRCLLSELSSYFWRVTVESKKAVAPTALPLILWQRKEHLILDGRTADLTQAVTTWGWI